MPFLWWEIHWLKAHSSLRYPDLGDRRFDLPQYSIYFLMPLSILLSLSLELVEIVIIVVPNMITSIVIEYGTPHPENNDIKSDGVKM